MHENSRTERLPKARPEANEALLVKDQKGEVSAGARPTTKYNGW